MAIVAMALPMPAAAHGVRTRVVTGDTTVVTVTHEDGDPLAGASFTVRAPGGALPFSQGTTDARGQLAFRPDRPGDWRVRVATADGHGAVVTVTIAPPTAAVTPGPSPSNGPTSAASAASAAPPPAPAGAPRAWRAVGGALLLVGVFAFVASRLRGRAR